MNLPQAFFPKVFFFSIFGNQQQKSQLRKIQLEFLRTFGTDGTHNWRFLLLEGAVRSEGKRDERFFMNAQHFKEYAMRKVPVDSFLIY